MLEKLSEQEATEAFLNYFSAHGEAWWDQTYVQLTDVNPGFHVTDRRVATFELTLAAIAVSLQAVKNIRGKDQFERITQWVFHFANTESWGDYAVPCLKEYLLLCDNFAKSPIANLAYAALTSRLLERLLEEDVSGIEGTFYLLTMPLNNSLMQVAMSWSWKTLFQQRDIVPETSPSFGDPMLDSRLTQFLEGASSKPYRELIAYHIKRQSSKELTEAFSGEIRMIPIYLQEHMEYFIGYSFRVLTTNKSFWKSSNCREAFEQIIGLAIEVLPLTGHIDSVEDSLALENTGLAFQLFQTITLKLASQASSQRSLRALIGIRKGLFG